MSSLWSSFNKVSIEGKAAVVSDVDRQTELEDPGNTIFREIQAETKDDLAFINPENLRDATLLGNGTSFRVTREVFHQPGGTEYYVAVKRVVAPIGSTEELHKRLSVVRRELRVLMHPPLRSNSCVISILGQGYARDAFHGVIPYLVMDYSDHGTLSRYLKRCSITLNERRELALDVGMALRSLHDCHIIHGDVKMENILVFDSVDDVLGRPQMARLADFGSAIFEDDFATRRNVQYLGTTKYNAPEIAARCGPGVKDVESSYQMFEMADVYSFGLLLLETILNGESFVKRTWLDRDEGALDGTDKTTKISKELAFLREITKTEDELLRLTMDFGDRLPPGADPGIIQYVKQTLQLCLKDNALKRGNMAQITGLLAQGTEEERPRITRALSYISPPTLPSIAPMDLPRRKPGAHYTMLPPTSENLTIRMIDPSDNNRDGSINSVQLSTHVSFAAAHTPSAYQEVDIDPFRASITISPPWEVQCSIVDRLKVALKTEENPEKQARLHLQLAVLHQLGYGVHPDHFKSLEHLATATDCNRIASYIYPRVLAGIDAEHVYSATSTMHCSDGAIGECSSAGLINFLKAERGLDAIHPLLPEGPIDVLRDLTIACMQGDFELAKQLIPNCGQFPAEYAPNPLHWLIMFPREQANYLLNQLLAGLTGSKKQHEGICRAVLNSSSQDMVNIPEYCMDLLGTPMHFAARCGYLDLVSDLICYGANINERWHGKYAFHSEARRVRYPSFSPLDIAVTYHFADIAQLLLEHGADTYGGDLQWEYSSFHMIGQKTVPFARYVAHGSNIRSAARQTIGTLRNNGLDINNLDTLSQTPLRCAIGNLDLEQYILEELLELGADAEKSHGPGEGNILAVLAQCCNDRRLSSSKLKILVDKIGDINKRNDSGLNALHYIALFDGLEAGRVLVAQPGIEVDCRALDEAQNTALLYAAKHGATGIAELLIGVADIELPDVGGVTPLHAAVNSRKIEVARLLLRAGANSSFQLKNGTKSNILHVAVINASQRPSVAKEVLAMLSPKQIEGMLNTFDGGGWTPLHVATYFGDLEGVRALLGAGADHELFKNAQRDSILDLNGTPLQLATRLIERTRKKGLGQDHNRIKKQGFAAEQSFMDRVEEIVRVLKRHTAK